MARAERAGAVATAVTVAVSFLTVCVPSAAAAPVSPASSGGSTWAYGALRTGASSSAAGPYPYEGTATIGFAVILNETNLSGGNVSLSVNRTMGLSLAVRFCHPGCGNATATATIDYRVWQTVNATVLLTDAASVTLSNGTSVAALGLNQSTVNVTTGLRENWTVLSRGATLASRNLSVGLSAQSATSFSPTLGLVPLAVAPPQEWNASSSYVESGSASWAIADQSRVGAVTEPPVDRTGGVSLNRTGEVGLEGADPGVSVRLGGQMYAALNLTILRGPFDLREGFLLLPAAADLFGPAAPVWLSSNASGTGSAAAAQSNIDVSSGLSTAGHLGFEGSGTWWSSSVPNPASSVVGPELGSRADASALPAAGGANATYLQGEPESVPVASRDQSCLATGVGCGSSARPSELGRELALVVGVGAVAVVLGALVVDRRRWPPTAYPNAALYPPSAYRTKDAEPAGPAPAPPADEDPLGHLW